MNLNVTEHRTETPAAVASEVWGWDDLSWEVKCEVTDCTHVLRTPKRIWRPVDYADRSTNAPMIQIDYTAPEAMLCVGHGARRFMGVDMPIDPDPVPAFQARRVEKVRGVHQQVTVLGRGGGFVVYVGGWKAATYKYEDRAVTRAIQELEGVAS